MSVDIFRRLQNGGFIMKKKVTALLVSALLLVGTMAGCSSGNSSGENSSPTSSASNELSAKMQDISTLLGTDKNATAVDMETLNSFFATLAGSTYKISGKASKYNCKNYNGYQIATVTLTNNGTKYIVSLKDADDSIKDGDYLEVEGKIGASLSADSSSGYGAFSLSNCIITARGDEVKKSVK